MLRTRILRPAGLEHAGPDPAKPSPLREPVCARLLSGSWQIDVTANGSVLSHGPDGLAADECDACWEHVICGRVLSALVEPGRAVRVLGPRDSEEEFVVRHAHL